MSEWQQAKLSAIADIRFSNVDKKSHVGELSVLLCNYMDVYSNDYIAAGIPFMEATATPLEIEKFKVELGDVIITKDSETPDDIGIPTVVTEDIPNLVCGYHLALIKPRVEKVDPIYLSKQLSTDHVVKYFGRFASGSTRYGLSSSAIAKTPIPVAPINEQRKIAKILSTVDNLIEKTQALIDKYQSIKQRMMHDLFTRGVDEHGQLRPSYEESPHLYKESDLGWIPKEWVVTKLQGVMDFLDGQRIPLKKEDRADMQGDIPYYGASGIIDYVNDYIFDGDYILLGEDGENVISRNVPLAFKVSGKMWVNNHAHILRPAEGSHIDFYTEYLESKDYSSIISGSAQPKITQGYLSRVMVIKPEYHEQVNIAQKLSSLHAKAEKENDYLDKLKVLKSGLMQDLLTGKVRVKVDA